MIRVLQLGNFGNDGGGISSVLHEFQSWNWPGSMHTFVDTYAQDPRLFGARRLSVAARAAWSRSNFDVAHVHLSQRGSFLREGALVRLAAARGRPVVATIHGSSFSEYALSHRVLVRSVLSGASQTAVLSPQARTTLLALGVENVQLVPNGVGPADASRADFSGPAARHLRVVFAGEFSRRKGADVLLSAWGRVVNQHPNATLLVFGPAKDVAFDPVEGVTYMGRRPRAEVRAALARSQLVVLPSRAEAFPMSLLEAMAAGLPVIATDVGGVSQMLEDPDQVIRPGSSDELFARMSAYLSDPGLCAIKGEANLSRYLANYSPRAVATQYELLYQHALEKSG